MDVQSSRLLNGLVLVGLVAVFAAVFSWQYSILAPAIEANRIFFQLILAVTAIAVLRTEVGISTFGVFAPTIIAFAWIGIGPAWGLLVITYLFVVAAVTRMALERFEIGTPHRVAIILTMISLALFTLEAISVSQPSVPQFQLAVLFPAIITAWYGERFVSQVQDTGWPGASRRLAWTGVTVAVADVVVTFDPLVDWFAATPLAWAAIVGVHLLLGSVTSVRLTEYARFKTLRRARASEHSTTDVLSMRVRNRDFVSRYNPRYLLASLDKLRQKRIFHGLDLPTPETYLLFDDPTDLDALDDLLEERDAFALKPTASLGGEGILVVDGRTDDGFQTARGTMTAAEIRSHARDIVDGRFDPGYAVEGTGYVEALVRPRGDLYDVCKRGVPDLRLIVLRGIPVMAMARLPTEESQGAANLHGGAVGVAIDIADGKAGGAYQQTRNRWLEAHPDTGTSFDFAIDDWQSVLELASEAATASHLGYAGVDIVFDRERGPVVLEINRRPGLGIQNVTMDSLLHRLRLAERDADDLSLRSSTDRVEAAREWAAADWEVSVDVQ